MSSHLLFSI